MKTITTSSSYFNFLVDIFRYPAMLAYAWPIAIFYIPFDKMRTAFIRSMSIEAEQLQIDYSKWGRKRVKDIPLLQLIIKLYCYQDDFRAPKYYVMKLEVNGRPRYEIDSRDGFTKEQFLAFMEEFTAAKNACIRERSVTEERKGIC
ncbi:hypothetical protein CLV59_107313 [Chitinophaga dinghuensis]|uniref:Uncharacterized protein n=1 Tax=Chitinophaga dinghuensis TaxID=1539050 RepID=A0A327VSJ9_9BACT|nr:hypothetical protein [Chitinophaga dinghuensis]RAJ77546.1 hypothetical protein CLV59_107313 [Chitinophaga dinghuensis]